MDGTEVIVAVCGHEKVGKTTFIAKCLGVKVEELMDELVSHINICGRDITVKIVESPEMITRAILVAVLFDITQHESYVGLPETLEFAHRMCPTAYIVIIGTKADLRKSHHVTTEEAERFCQNYHNRHIPYYEICKDPPDGILALFKEILARPLINLHILKMATVQENIVFVHETMKWAIESGSANILTHLRELGYSIPEDLIQTYDDVIASYLLSEYPLKPQPNFTMVKRPEFLSNYPDSELDEDTEPTSVIDMRTSLVVSTTYLLQLSDISLTFIPPALFLADLVPVTQITHVDVSQNLLTTVPLELFQLPSLQLLNLSHNEITGLPLVTQWACPLVEILILSHNCLSCDMSSPIIYNQKKLQAGGPNGTLFPKLWYIDISNNGLKCCPPWLFIFRYVKHLDLSYNKIQQLPSEIALMSQLRTLLLKDLPLTDPPPPIQTLSTQSLLSYLHFKHQSSQAMTSMRVVIVGPEKVGKSTLIARLKGDNTTDIPPTKGLEVSEWRYKGDVLKRHPVTFDLWDFSGSERYKFIYSCFKCQNSLHIAVFDINTTSSEIIRWLSDIQSQSVQRVPLLVVFAHMDKCSSRESKEEIKRKRTEWLKYNLTINEKVDSSPAFALLTSTMSQTVKSLQDLPLERHSMYERLQQAFDVQEYSSDIIPLMPFVLGTHFVSNSNNEGISQLRKVLYRIGTRSFRTTHPVLQTIGIEVPTVYTQVESLIRQLRGHFKEVKTEGEQKAFYMFSELRDRLRRPLKQLDITGADFLAALRFLHERGVVYLYDSARDENGLEAPLVAINPQIIGFLIQRTIRAGEAQSEGNLLSGFLPNVHPIMIWGVNSALFSEGPTRGITAIQLIDFLMSLDLCAPLVPGACLIPSLLPPIPVPGTTVELNDLETRRVYILGYLPSFFWPHLMCRVLRTLAHHHILQGDHPLTPTSPSSLPPRPNNPLITPTGAKLYLWQKHFIFEDVDGSKLLILILEGGQLGPESTPFCGRVDILMSATQEKEALLLRLVTEEIDQLLSERYPSLLDDSHTPLMVEIFIPLTLSWFNHLTTPTHSSLSSSKSPSLNHPLEEQNQEQLSGVHSHLSITNTTSPPSFNGSLQSVQGTLQEAIASIKATGSLPRQVNSEEIYGGKGEGTPSDQDWEMLSGRSDGRPLSFIEDYSLSTTQYLVPAWECLQEAFKAPSFQLKNGSLDFRGLMPDLLCADYPASLLITIPESHMIGVKIQEEKGMFLHQYYTDKVMEGLKKRLGAEKMFALKQNVTKLRKDLDLLCSLSFPYIMAPLGIQFSPPVLAMELSPHGSLRHYLDEGKTLHQSDTHQVALQVLSAVEFLETKELNYHYITCDNVFLWLLDPVTVKLSNSGLTHNTGDCVLCAELMTTLNTSTRKAKMNRFNLIMFGLLLFELSVGHRPYENILSLSTTILGIFHQQLDLNIEAHLQHRIKIAKETGHVSTETKTQQIKACHCLCMQSILQLCMGLNETTPPTLKTRLSICPGENTWGPLNLTLDVECLLPSPDSSLVYWASGSRGLVVGNINPESGKLYSRILAEAPTPESGLFANRRGKPIPIAVGHATAMDLCQATNQIWVGTENGLMGSVYVFNLPDMKSHHYIHLQDAVLSLKVVNNDSSHSNYQTLVGLANGTIILFMGKFQGRTFENPLQAPKKVITTYNRKPCLSIGISSEGYIWTACGDNLEVFDSTTMSSISCHACKPPEDSPQKGSKGDVIIYMALSKRGVWTVTRRSTVLSLWDMVTGDRKATFNVRNILRSEYNEITALVVQGGTIWVGTRSGYILLLDAAAITNHEQEKALRGMQYCGDGRIKGIAPFPLTLKVLCSVEYPDEVSGCLMTWEYQSISSWQPSHRVATPTSSNPPALSKLVDEDFVLNFYD